MSFCPCVAIFLSPSLTVFFSLFFFQISDQNPLVCLNLAVLLGSSNVLVLECELAIMIALFNSLSDLPHFHCHYLWEFLHHILLQKHNKYIMWKNQSKGVFRLIDHNGLARLWGRQKNRKNMTYEKLSRALRYYYSKNILKKVPGQRLTYKFVRNLNGKKYPM